MLDSSARLHDAGDDIDDGSPSQDHVDEWMMNGDRCIAAPDVEWSSATTVNLASLRATIGLIFPSLESA